MFLSPQPVKLTIKTTAINVNKIFFNLFSILEYFCILLLFQLIFNTSGEQLEFLPEIPLRFNYLNITLAVAILVIYLLVKKYLPVKFLFLIGVLSLMVYILTLNFGIEPFGTFTIKIYEDGVITGFFIIARVFILIMFSSLLTLTTKPTDINNGLEAILKPFELLGLKTSILAMMISIALRYIPTLFNETQKILKAQALNEGKPAAIVDRMVEGRIKKYFKDLTFETTIPRNVRVAEAPSHGAPIGGYDALSRGARAYKEFAKEVEERTGRRIK